MAVNDLLSQEEIDALLQGIGEGDIETDSVEPVAEGEVRSYDFSSQDRIIRGRMPSLEMINDRLGRYFTTSLSALLRRPVEVNSTGVQTMKFAEYSHSLYVPTSLNVVRMRPLKGNALCVLDPKMVYGVVDQFFGGGNYAPRIEGRDFTLAERRVINHMLEALFIDLKHAWEPVLSLEIELTRMESNPQTANLALPSEVVVVNGFHVEMEGGGGGDLHVTLPYTMLEPIRELLETGAKSEAHEVDELWAEGLRARTKEATIEIYSILTETPISLREVLNFKAGDVVPVDLPEQIVLYAEGVPMCRGRFGVSEGINAIKVESRLGQVDPV